MEDIFRHRQGLVGECALRIACLFAGVAQAACGGCGDSTLDATDGGPQRSASEAPRGAGEDGAGAKGADLMDGAAIRDGESDGRDDGSGDATHGSPGIAEGGSGPTDGRGPETGAESGGPHGDGGGVSPCKRGVAANATPSSALAPTPSSPGVSWWYNWSNQGAAPPAGIEFVPMIWGSGSLAGPIPTGSSYLLGFNEPNFKSQSNLTPQQAAADWPRVEALAKATADIPIVSPAVNFCGSASNPSGCSDPSVTDPYTYLKDFFAACTGCKVDAVAVHWYNCDLPSLQAYIEGNDGGLQGFTQFGKPIWLTEFSCDNSHSVAQQKAYMQAAVPWLESNPHIVRYSWFSATNISNALLMNSDGTLTDLGMTYVSLAQNCP
jgi:hypothetical protein